MTVPARSAVPKAHTWNAESVFASEAEWAAELKSVSESLADLKRFHGHLGDGPAALLAYIEASSTVLRRVFKVGFYAQMTQACDTSDAKAQAMAGQAGALIGQMFAALAFADPETIAIGHDTLKQWMAQEPRLQIFKHYADNLFRIQAHVRSGEVEELLGLLQDPFGMAANTHQMLMAADMKIQAALSGDGQTLPVTQGTINKLLDSPDRETRRTAWEHYADAFLASKHTLASNLTLSLKQDALLAQARRYQSSLEAALAPNNIATSVFHNLVETFKKNLPTWHKYWRVRRKALGVDTLHPYDIWAPLSSAKPHVPYEQAVEWICAGMTPLGAEYVETVRRGCLEQRWVDIYPNQGKTQGAFSYGTPDTYPFIMMNYSDNLGSMSTLAHELGHSMHSYHTWRHQPILYAQYSLFVAEVASNFNQALVRDYLMKTHSDPQFQIALIEEALGNFHRYFFIMPTLARFEFETHSRVEQGQGLNADELIGLMADLFSEAYGGEMHIDRERVGITWATFPHLYQGYYVFQYATGISGAHALAERVLAGVPNAAQDYLAFLSAGGSLYPLDALKRAGVDLSTPEAVEKTFAVLARYVDRLEQLVG
ncbi:MAG: oligoendopeptidase F [Chloroflexi bacterium]|nr:oligoendopeptidase F [Chloroflexota bacterium]